MGNALKRLGVTTYIDKANTFTKGGKSYNDETYSTVLGGMTYGISPLEMAGAFSTFANRGIYYEPTTILKIENKDGVDLIKDRKNTRRVTTEGVAYLLTDMLTDVVTKGTGKVARIKNNNEGIPVAGKTGTTSGNKDAWFVGCTPYYTASVWVGNDLNESLPKGSGLAAEIWSDIMKGVHEDLPDKDFPETNDIVEVEINPNDGKLATRYTRKVKMIYAKGFEPTEESEYTPPIRVTTPVLNRPTKNPIEKEELENDNDLEDDQNKNNDDIYNNIQEESRGSSDVVNVIDEDNQDVSNELED